MKFSRIEAICLVIILVLIGAAIQRIANRPTHQESRSAAVKAVETSQSQGETLKLNFASVGSTHWPTHVTLPSATPTPKPASTEEKYWNSKGFSLDKGSPMVPPASAK